MSGVAPAGAPTALGVSCVPGCDDGEAEFACGEAIRADARTNEKQPISTRKARPKGHGAARPAHGRMSLRVLVRKVLPDMRPRSVYRR